MAEEGSGCPVPRLAWASLLRSILLPFFAGVVGAVMIYSIFCSHCAPQKQQLESPGWDIAELQLNHTGLREDPRLCWQGSPALGRSFIQGPELDNGQLRVQRAGVYRLHIQVTLANCSSRRMTTHRPAALAVGVCSPASRSFSLLRLSFHRSCTVASQRLVPLARGDVLCANLTLSLLPSRNSDETFFGVHWVHP